DKARSLVDLNRADFDIVFLPGEKRRIRNDLHHRLARFPALEFDLIRLDHDEIPLVGIHPSRISRPVGSNGEPVPAGSEVAEFGLETDQLVAERLGFVAVYAFPEQADVLIAAI